MTALVQHSLALNHLTLTGRRLLYRPYTMADPAVVTAMMPQVQAMPLANDAMAGP